MSRSVCRRSLFGAALGAFAALLGLPCRSGAASYHPGHHCPKCGTAVYVVARRGPGPGQHYHAHGNTWWYH